MATLLTEQESGAVLYPVHPETGEPMPPSYNLLLGGHADGLTTTIALCGAQTGRLHTPEGAVSLGPVTDLDNFQPIQVPSQSIY